MRSGVAPSVVQPAKRTNLVTPVETPTDTVTTDAVTDTEMAAKETATDTEGSGGENDSGWEYGES